MLGQRRTWSPQPTTRKLPREASAVGAIGATLGNLPLKLVKLRRHADAARVTAAQLQDRLD
jgi:hypothetical protein